MPVLPSHDIPKHADTICNTHDCTLNTKIVTKCTDVCDPLQLFESMEGPRPVPVSKETIDRLPRVAITKEQQGMSAVMLEIP